MYEIVKGKQFFCLSVGVTVNYQGKVVSVGSTVGSERSGGVDQCELMTS